MTMKIKRILSYLTASSLAILFAGCSLMGLDLQKKYDYDYSVPYSNQLDVNGWDFMMRHQDDFELFIEAVDYAGIDHELFNRPGITIFPLMNGGISATAGTGTNSNPDGYWKRHQVWVDSNGDGIATKDEIIEPESWAPYSKETVRQFVLNHILTMPVSFGEFLDMVPDGRRTFFPSMAESKYGYVSLHMLNFAEEPNGGERITRLYVNDFPSHFTKSVPNMDNWDRYFYPHSPNLKTKNGSYIHVMNNMHLEFPIDGDLELVPIYKKNDWDLSHPQNSSNE